MAVSSTDQENKGIKSSSIPNARKLLNVLIKFTAPNKEEAPARCNEKIAKSTEDPAWAKFKLRGG